MAKITKVRVILIEADGREVTYVVTGSSSRPLMCDLNLPTMMDGSIEIQLRGELGEYMVA